MSWSTCLEHLRNTDHAPPEPPKGNGPREDTSACLRRWMAACSAAARGEFPTASSGVQSKSEAIARVKLLRIPRLSCSTRCSAVVNHLALECIRCADRHSCCVWLQAHGLELRASGGDVDFAAVAEDLMTVLRFAIPDIEDKSERDGNAFQAESEPADASSLWTQWMQCMVEQQAGEDVRDDADRAAGGMSSLRATALPFVPLEVACQAASLRMLVLCGLPGSGKSTLAARLRVELGWTIVNQDTLTSRQACMKAARAAFKEGDTGKVVIDRCNFNVAQRAPWVQLAIHEFGLQSHELCCVWLDVPAEECNRRVLTRLGHNSLPPRASSLEVIRRFADFWQQPDAKEGFGSVRRLASDIDIETLCAEMRGTPNMEPYILSEGNQVVEGPAQEEAKAPLDSASGNEALLTEVVRPLVADGVQDEEEEEVASPKAATVDGTAEVKLPSLADEVPLPLVAAEAVEASAVAADDARAEGTPLPIARPSPKGTPPMRIRGKQSPLVMKPLATTGVQAEEEEAEQSRDAAKGVATPEVEAPIGEAMAFDFWHVPLPELALDDDD